MGSGGKTFVMTGEFKTMARTDAKYKLEMLGHKVTGGVSSKTDYLVTNLNTPTVKYKKAQDLDIPIINETELVERFLS